MKNGFHRVLFVVFLLGKGLNAAIIQGPSNAVSEIGEQVKLGCIADSGIGYWVLSKNGDVNSELEIVGPGCSALNAAFADHYIAESLNGGKTCNLIIFNITMEQAGVYRCIQASHFAFSIHTVIDSSPNITDNSTTSVVENESVLIACSLKHNGSVEPASTLQPYFYWTNSSGQNVSSSYDSTTNITAVSQLTVTAGRQNIASYTCHVYLQLIPPTTPGYAGNTPTVNNSASSTTIEVLYCPGNMSITSSVSTTDKCVYKQESLTCVADANPPAQYEWLDLSNNYVTDGSVKSITTGGQFKCTAYNFIRNQIHNKTKTATETSCYAVTQSNMTINGPSCTNGTCYCTGSQTATMTCVAHSIPDPSYKWRSDVPGFESLGNNDTIHAIFTGNYSCTATNRFGGMDKTGTVSIMVSNCTAPPTTLSTSTISTTAKSSTIRPTSGVSTKQQNTSFFAEDNTTTTAPGLKPREAVGIAIGCILVINVLATCLFIGYYNKGEALHPGTNAGTESAKTERNKMALNKKFPWLQKMLPCLNNTKENTGNNGLWISLFILVATLTGCVTFPIWILLAKKFEKSQESSALNKRENGDENESTENGRRPANSSLSPSQSMNPESAMLSEGPYQNYTTERIELQNSPQSKTFLSLDSLSHRPSPELKPTTHPFSMPGRAVNYKVPQPSTNPTSEARKATNNQDPSIEYAELPIINRNNYPTTRPVQLFDVASEDTYARLNKT